MKKDLPIKPDRVTLELLSRARLFLEHAISHASSKSSVDRMIAIHGMDNSVEYLLRIISRHLEYESKTNSRLPDDLSGMAGELNKFLSGYYDFNLPYLNEIKLLRKIRNLVQHGASDPAPEMNRLSNISTRFFKKISEKIFGLEPNSIKISSLIENESVSKLLKEAEDLIDKEEFLQSIVKSRDAFENALLLMKPTDHSFLDTTPIKVENNQSFWSRLLIENLVTNFRLGSYGIDLNKFNRYQEILRHVPSEYKVLGSGHSVMMRDWNINDARFVYGFVSDSIMKLQELEMEPLYETDSLFDDNKRIVETLADIELSDPKYSYHDPQLKTITQYIVDAEKNNNLKALTEGKLYKAEQLTYSDNILERKLFEEVKLHKLYRKLVTNEPERWEVILETELIPFSRIIEDYDGGELIGKTPSLNESELANLKVLRINEKTAQRIVSYRESEGKINGIMDLKRINGITDREINYLKHSSTL